MIHPHPHISVPHGNLESVLHIYSHVTAKLTNTRSLYHTTLRTSPVVQSKVSLSERKRRICSGRAAAVMGTVHGPKESIHSTVRIRCHITQYVRILHRALAPVERLSMTVNAARRCPSLCCDWRHHFPRLPRRQEAQISVYHLVEERTNKHVDTLAFRLFVVLPLLQFSVDCNYRASFVRKGLTGA